MPFTKMDNQVLGAVIRSRLTQRQLKILLLIARFSFGFHKSYAVLSRSDFEAAGVSPSAVTEQLNQLVALRVIRWEPTRNQVWINRNVTEWAVEKVVHKPGRMMGIAHNNSVDRRVQVSQIGNVGVLNSGRHIKKIEKKENKQSEVTNRPFIHLLQQYVQLVAPITTSEAVILREVVATYEQEMIMAAIVKVSGMNDRSFANFLRELDQLAGDGQCGRFGQLRSRLQRYLNMIPGP